MDRRESDFLKRSSNRVPTPKERNEENYRREKKGKNEY